jgi:orotidine-5'-phosphate decarboxylase
MKSIEKYFIAKERCGTSLCIGIDPDFEKIPSIFPKNAKGIGEFSKLIIEITKDIATAYKINFAFFEIFGSAGFAAIEDLVSHIPANIFTIADAKRGDIGNTSKFYAKSVFEHFNFDSITVNPMMGKDSIEPFFAFPDKLVFLLGITSNAGANDFLKLKTDNSYVFENIFTKAREWFPDENLGFVTGATQIDEFSKARELAPSNLFLIPGVGAQGGNLQKLKEQKLDPCLINVSRDILFASNKIDFAEKARAKALEYAKLF